MSRVSVACASVLALTSLTGAAHAQGQMQDKTQGPVADRYGPAAPSYDPASSPPAALAGAPIHMLSWPGKVTPLAATTASEPTPVRQPAAAISAPAPRLRPVQIASATLTPSPSPYRARYVAPVEQAQSPPPPTQPAASTTSPHYGLVQAYPSPAAPSDRKPTPYDDAPVRPGTPVRAQAIAAPPTIQTPFRPDSPARAAADAPVAPSDPAHPGWAPPRRAWSQAGDSGVRFYSLHRQYGVKPDPAPLPPQFFTATADMGEPSGPLTRTISGAGSAAQATRAVQAAQAETASDAASGQP